MKNLEEVIISVIKGAEEVEAKYKWNGRRYVTSNGMTGKLVRCEDCRKSHIDGKTTHYLWCTEWGRSTDLFGYCERGEREGE